MTLREVCDSIVEECLALRPTESLLIVGAHQGRPHHHALLWEASERRGARALHLAVPPPTAPAGVPASVIGAAMSGASAVVLGTPWIFPHDLRRQALTAGARVLSLCTVTDEMLLRAAAGQHERLARYTRRLADRIRAASEWVVRTPAGTDLRARIAGRAVIVLDGLARTPGTWSGLPAGVIAVTPIPGAAEGRLVLDGSVDGYGLVREPPSVSIVHGRVVDIQGGEAAEFLRRRFASVDEGGRRLCEVGIGTNPRAAYVGNLVEDERVRGSSHVGFGGNIHLGGELASALHLDATMRRPTILLDGEPLVVDGVPIIEGP